MTGKSKSKESRTGEILKAYIGTNIIVHLKTGKVINATLVGYDALFIKLRDGKVIRIIPISSIEEIYYFIEEDLVGEGVK